MKRHLLLSTATVFLLSVPVMSMAQQPAKPSQATQQQAQLSQQDRQFVEKAAMSDQFEIQTGKLATEKARNDKVKTFGQHMIDDHGKTSATMKTLAQQKSVELPTKLDAEHQRKLTQLQGLSGAQFDSAYVQGQLEAHQTAVTLFERQAQQGQDSDLKSFALQTLPTLKEHLQQVQSMQPALASNGNAAANQTTAQTATGQSVGGAVPGQMPAQTSFSNLMGKDVYGDNNQKLGDVADVILDPQSGNATAVVLDRGGLLGIGAKQIALDYKLLDVTDDRIVARQITEDQVKAMPEFQYDDTMVSYGKRNTTKQ